MALQGKRRFLCIHHKPVGELNKNSQVTGPTTVQVSKDQDSVSISYYFDVLFGRRSIHV